MSIGHVNNVWAHSSLSGTSLLVLLAIADHEGEAGSWPSHATLARYARCSKESVKRGIKEAVAAGELSVEVNAGGAYGARPDRRPNLYRVLIACPADCDGSPRHNPVQSQPDGGSPEAPREDLGGGSPMTPRDGNGGSNGAHGGSSGGERGVTHDPQTIIEPPIENQDLRTPNPTELTLLAHPVEPGDFDRWYAAYPRHVGKTDARRAYQRAVKQASPTILLAAVQRYAADPNLPEKRFIPYPARWLNRGGWDDESCPRANLPAATVGNNERLMALQQRIRDRELAGVS